MITVTDRKYFSELINGPAFSLNTGDYTTNLVGSAMEKIRAQLTFTLSVISDASIDPETFTLSTGQIERDINLWEDEDWRIGFTFVFLDGGVTFTGTVTGFDSTGLILYYTIGTGTATPGAYTAATVKLTSDLLGAEFHYGLIENSEGTNYLNKIDGSDMMYQLNGLTATLQDMNVAGALSWYTGAAQIKQTAPISGGICEYVIVQDFIIPYYKQTWRANILAGTLPTDLFAGSKTLKHVWNIKLRTALSNPNSEISYVDDTILGSVGFFGENYNGLGNNYTFALTEYEDTLTGDTVSDLQINRKTTVKFTIASSSKFTAATKIGFYGSAILTPAQYAANTTEFEPLWNWENLIVTCDTLNTGTGCITRFDSVLNNTSLITCEVDVEFTTAQQLLLIENQEFLIAGQVADPLLTQPHSDKVISKIDLSTLSKNTDVAGLYENKSLEFLTHGQADTDTGYTNLAVYVQENTMMKYKFGLNLDNNAYLRSIRREIVAIDSDGNEFVIDVFYADLSSEVLIPTGLPGVYKQAFSLDTTMGYVHPADDFMNRNRLMEFIDSSPYRWGEQVIAAAGANFVILQAYGADSGFLNNNYTLIPIDIDGGGFDIKNIVNVSSQFNVTALSPGTIRYFAVHNDAALADTVGVRWGTETLPQGAANPVTFASTLGTTNYALIIVDIDGGGIIAPTKSATGFTIDAITDTHINYLAAIYTGIDGIEAGSQAILAGANTITFANPLASNDYTLMYKTWENVSNNFVLTGKTANGFSFTVELAGTLDFIAKMNI